MRKATAYNRLVAERVECRRCQGLTNPARVDAGRLDSREIGPWSRWQGNLDAKLMVVGQDWGGIPYFTKHSGLEGPRNPTNETLRELIELLGVDVGPPGDLRRNGVVFFTNAVLCLKQGTLQGTVQPQWFRNCSSFLKRQVEIIRPTLLVCLGERAYRSLAYAFSFQPGNFSDAVASREGIVLPSGTRAFARFHCGRRTQNVNRPLHLQRRDWKKLARFL
jgi:uracil-DNA glycosylase family 4